MPRPSKTCRAQLLALHAMYGDFNQKERADCRLMVELRHPAALEYRRLRRFFDSLRYACNASTRLYTFGGRDERAEFHAPALTLAWYPEGALRRFGHIYPAHDDWEKYIRAAAAAGWAGAEPRVEASSWQIATRNAELVDRLEHLAHSHDLSIRSASAASGAFGLVINDVCDAEQNRTVANILREFQGPFVLPSRTRKDDEADRSELPLKERRFALASVSKLTVTPRMVMVPLIPAGDEEAAAVVVNDVVSLLGQGYPFSQASGWLRSVLKSASFHSLSQRLAGNPPGSGAAATA